MCIRTGRTMAETTNPLLYVMLHWLPSPRLECYITPTKSEGGQRRGNQCGNITLAFSESAKKEGGGGNQCGYISSALSTSLNRGAIHAATQPLPCEGPHSGELSMWHLLCLPRSQSGENQSCGVTFAFLGPPKWARIMAAAQLLPSWDSQSWDQYVPLNDRHVPSFIGKPN